MKSKMLVVLVVSFSWLVASAFAIDLLKENEAKIKREVWDPAVKTMPTKYSGTVRLDGKPLAGVSVTDGIGFVKTDADGRYAIDVKFDAMTPYLPARVISVRWPEGTWPVKHKLTGRLLFWRRVKDVQKTPNKVDFLLTRRVIAPPLVISLGTDPHGNLWDNWSYIMPQEVKRAANRVHLGMMLGDLTYADMKGVSATFPHFEKYARDFPITFLHLMGNHDIPGPFFAANELAGNGAFQKWLGPVRMSFDVAGVHVVIFNYWLVNRQAVDWLDEELASVPPGKPVYIFTHSWGPYLGPICQKYPNIRLVTAGHSHKTRFCGREGNAEFWTFYAFYRLLYIDGYDHEFIDRRAGENALYNYYNHSVGAKGSRTAELPDATLTNASSGLKGYSGKDTPGDKNGPFGTSEQYDVTFSIKPAGKKPATRFGLRITNERGYVFKFYYDTASKTLNFAGRETYFDPEPVVARMPTKHPSKEVWDSYKTVDKYIKSDPKFRSKSDEKAKYQAALAAERKWLTVDRQKIFEAWRKKSKPIWPIRFDINICPDRIQTFVNNNIAHIQFYKIGPAARIEIFAENGQAAFSGVKAFETGAGAHWKKFTRPILNHLP
ncbi:MAG: metallophosphoesterase N-terminal domain-containing protein [Phycisphaerae bacterium]|nr:metallophosphoesterase N-terminal domain-containing protein [Phycisphaerae bacterium]